MKRLSCALCLSALSLLAQAEPPRIASLSWEPTEHLLALGITPLAVADAADYRSWVVRPRLPAQSAELGSRTEPNLEALAELKPELILITPLLEDIRPNLERIAPVISYGDFTQKQDNLALQRQNFLDLGQRLGLRAQAQHRLAQMDADVATLRAQLDRHFAGQPPKVTVIRFASATQAYLFGPNSLPEHALTLLGLKPALQVPTSRWGSLQTPITALAGVGDGAVIYIEPFAQQSRLFSSTLWQAMPFVRNKRLVSMPPTWTHGGVLSVQYLAEAITGALLKLPPRKP